MSSAPRPPRPVEPDEPDSGPRRLTWLGTGEVLVADDDPAMRKVLCRTLERFGLVATAVEDGDDAVAEVAAAPGRWRLVVLDLTMPRMGGADALAGIRAHRRDLPAIVLSGYLEAEIREQVRDASGVAFMQKPFTLRTLADLLWEILGPQA